MLKGVKHIIKVDIYGAAGIGAVLAALSYVIVKPMVVRKTVGMTSEKASVNKLFVFPLIFSAALLSFAHGANDVANAVGPLAGIYDAIMTGEIAKKAPIPLWVMVIGALGIAFGLALYGPKLIRTVGSEITELDQARAFCIAMSAAITVIFASQMGMPISSTHVAIGAVFGVGFLREYIKKNYRRMLDEIREHHAGADEAEVEAFLTKFEAAPLIEKQNMLTELKARKAKTPFTKHDRKSLNREVHKAVVKRSMALKIASAWIITVPLSGAMAAMLFFTIRGFMLP